MSLGSTFASPPAPAAAFMACSSGDRSSSALDSAAFGPSAGTFPGSPTPLSATFVRIASHADGDRSFASTTLSQVSTRSREVLSLIYLTSGISLAYRIDLRPVADRASRMVNCFVRKGFWRVSFLSLHGQLNFTHVG